MVDLGTFNFIKNALAQGKTKEEIVSNLSKGGLNQIDIDAAFMAVQNNQPPMLQRPLPATPIQASTITTSNTKRYVPIILVTIVLIGGYFVFSDTRVLPDQRVVL